MPKVVLCGLAFGVGFWLGVPFWFVGCGWVCPLLRPPLEPLSVVSCLAACESSPVSWVRLSCAQFLEYALAVFAVDSSALLSHRVSRG